jgi:hypothetical protein
MRIFLIILRVGVFLLALLGVAGSGGLGYKWWSDSTAEKPKFDLAQKKMAALRVLVKEGLGGPTTPSDLQKASENFDNLNSFLRPIPFLMAGAVIGLLGGVLALIGRTLSGAVLLFLASAGSGVLQPITLIFTCPLIAAGLGSLFVSFLAFVTRPKPRPEGAEDEDDRSRSKRKNRTEDEEDEEPPVKSAAKRKRDEDEEEPPVKGRAKHEVEFAEDEEPAPPPKAGDKLEEYFEEDEEEAPPPKAGGKRKVSSDEDEEPEPPARTGAKRKRS